MIKAGITLPQPASWLYIENDELKLRKKAAAAGQLLMYPNGAQDEIYVSWDYNDKLLAFLKMAVYGQDNYDPPLLISLTYKEKEYQVYLAYVTDDKPVLNCKFWVVDLTPGVA